MLSLLFWFFIILGIVMIVWGSNSGDLDGVASVSVGCIAIVFTLLIAGGHWLFYAVDDSTLKVQSVTKLPKTQYDVAVMQRKALYMYHEDTATYTDENILADPKKFDLFYIDYSDKAGEHEHKITLFPNLDK